MDEDAPATCLEEESVKMLSCDISASALDQQEDTRRMNESSSSSQEHTAAVGKSPRLPLEQELDSSRGQRYSADRYRSEYPVNYDFVRQPSSSSQSATSADKPPSNETLLCTAFASFTTFALLELVFAIIAGSDAMMGDSAAMMVDALTYLFNWYGERRKKQYETDTIDHVFRSETIRERIKRKYFLQMEIIPPIVSVSTLLIVTVIVLRKSVKVLVLDFHRNKSDQKNPSVNIMLIFSALNLLLDILNVFCFAKAKHLLGFTTVEENHADDDDGELRQQGRPNIRVTNRSYAVVGGKHDHAGDEKGEGTCDQSLEPEDFLHSFQAHDEHANLNMCSAYTHVFADTLRSVAVIIACLLAMLIPGVTPEEADAAAAICVSILIALSLVPLFQGLSRSVSELQSILALERQEVLFPDEHENHV
jgi:Co/Zn/Cd efflux system component